MNFFRLWRLVFYLLSYRLQIDYYCLFRIKGDAFAGLITQIKREFQKLVPNFSIDF